MHPENLTLFDDPEIADIIDHINEDHSDDMKHMALGLLNLTKVQQKTLQNATLRQIYQQGLLLDLQFTQNEPHLDNQLLAFSEPTQTLEKFNDQYVALLQRSDRKQGKKTIDIKQRQFCLQSVEAVSHHMYRLTVQTDSDLSDLPAGYAFLFDVKLPDTDLKKHPRPYRYYTLRKAWQTVNENGSHGAAVRSIARAGLGRHLPAENRLGAGCVFQRYQGEMDFGSCRRCAPACRGR